MMTKGRRDLGNSEWYIAGDGEDTGNIEDDYDTVYNLEDKEEEYKDVDFRISNWWIVVSR